MPLVREERGVAASSVPVVLAGNAGQPRRKGLPLKASKREPHPEKRRPLVPSGFARGATRAPVEDGVDGAGV